MALLGKLQKLIRAVINLNVFFLYGKYSIMPIVTVSSHNDAGSGKNECDMCSWQI
jgi:hypothetical protein